MSNHMKDMTPDFHCPFCPQKRTTWDTLMFHIGSSHSPDLDVLDLQADREYHERTELRETALREIERERGNFLPLILTDEWIEVLRANVN